MKNPLRICVLALCLLPWTARPLAARGTLPAWRPGAAGDLVFETSPFVSRAAYANPDRASKDLADDGAYGVVNRAWDRDHGGK